MKRSEEDIKLAEKLKNSAPQAPENEWFVRKVMNRLPQKRRPVYSRAEVFTLVLSAILLLVGWCMQISHMLTSPVITSLDLVYSGVLFISSLAFMGYVAYPMLKRV